MSNELVVAETGFLISPDEIEVVREDVMCDGFAPWDLDSVKVPAGGSTVWEIETLEGVDVAKTIDGVVVHNYTPRVLWEGEFGDDDGAVVCRSHDGRTGFGSPGGKCRTCPMAAFGSGKGNAQACKSTMKLYVLQSGQLIPMEVNLSPTSIKPAQKFFLQLVKHKLSKTSVVTSIGLTKTTKNGYTYSVANFSVARRLSPEESATMREFSKFFGSWVKDSLLSGGNDSSSEEIPWKDSSKDSYSVDAEYEEAVPF